MNPPTTHKPEPRLRGPLPPPALGNGSRRPTASDPIADPEQDPTTESVGVTAPAVLSGDRLVVSVAEAGELLGVSRAFAYELAARGDLKTIRLGRRVLVPKVALLAMVGLAPSQS